jgi:antitoxin component YwqK of YwqJK toxin-antitoxin module
MKILYIIILISMSFIPGSPTENGQPVDNSAGSTSYMNVSGKDNKLYVKNRVLYYDTMLFTGKVTQLYNSGDTQSVTEYKNGKQNGVQISYYENGRVNEARYYIDGRKEGEHQAWWENGSQKFVYHFKNDVFDGSVKMWNESGMLFNDFNYVNGHEDGLQKSWFENGSLRANYVVKNNRKYGLTGVKNCISVTDDIKK